MVNKMALMPQELETFYIIPTLRRYFAHFMQEKGRKQKDIARILNINSATISQYRSNKRGHRLDFDAPTVAEIKKSVSKIVDTLTYIQETQRILNYLRETKSICKIHKELATVPAGCIPDTVGCHPVRGCL